jgi:putative ABC transport system substrate-binding protein
MDRTTRTNSGAPPWNPTSSNAQLEWKAVNEFAPTSDPIVTLYDARDFSELSVALERIKRFKPDALIMLNDPFLFTARKRVVDDLQAMRVPAIYGYREYADDGGLISYGTSIADTYRRAAQYVDKILNGGVPADLPIQLPTRFELVINLKTAKALGLDIHFANGSLRQNRSHDA